jgi:hypothetical protein
LTRFSCSSDPLPAELVESHTNCRFHGAWVIAVTQIEKPAPYQSIEIGIADFELEHPKPTPPAIPEPRHAKGTRTRAARCGGAVAWWRRATRLFFLFSSRFRSHPMYDPHIEPTVYQNSR